MIFGIIVAGGKGSRFGSEIPKQFLNLAEKPIIIHTLEKFLFVKKIDYIFVGVQKNWLNFTKRLFSDYNINQNKVLTAAAGSTRNITILNCFEEIEKIFGVNTEHFVVTHDAVRPFVTPEIIIQNIDFMLKHGVCSTAIPSTDTIIISKNGKIAADITNRNEMFIIQTPQSFNLIQFKMLYNKLNESEKTLLTDACSVFLTAKKKVFLVQGDVLNIKITVPNDYKIANAIVISEIFKKEG